MVDDFLRSFEFISDANRRGRNPKAGYQRAAGLKYTDLAKKLLAERDFQEAYALAMARSIVLQPRLMNLYLLIRFFLPQLELGHIIEFGCYRGGSAMFMAKLAAKHLPGVKVFALDSFEGMPPTDNTIDYHRIGDFSDTAYHEVLAAKEKAGLTNLFVAKGLFQDTAAKVLSECKTIALAHVDCDIYDAVEYSWLAVKPHMVPGGYVVFDDATAATCMGATEAVEDIVHRENLRSEQIDPHFVFRYPPLA